MAESLNMHRTISIDVWNAFEYPTETIFVELKEEEKIRGNYDDMRRCTLVVCLVVMTASCQSLIKLTF
jgi:hypothetical protein